MISTEIRLASLLSVLLATANLSAADTANLSPQKDNSLYEDPLGATSNGSGEHLFTGITNFGEIRRCLLAFQVDSTIPAGSTINSVTLQLNVSMTIALDVDFSLHRVDADWGEGASDAPFGEGQGGPAEPGDVTWLHTFFSSSFWSTVGGDFAGTASANFTLGAAGPYSISSPQMAADVQAWLDGTLPDFGWLIKAVDESIITTAKRFDSKENSLSSVRPVLVVDFDPPSVGTNYCTPATANSTGSPAAISGLGSEFVSDNNLTLLTRDLPLNQAGYYLNSLTQGSVANPGGSQGTLCLSGQIGRYSSDVAVSGPDGTISLLIDLTDTPTPSGSVSIVAGETWNFTLWYRDKNPGPTSNFSDGLSVLFQ